MPQATKNSNSYCNLSMGVEYRRDGKLQDELLNGEIFYNCEGCGSSD